MGNTDIVPRAPWRSRRFPLMMLLPSPRRRPITIVLVALVLAWSESPASASTVYVVYAEAAASGSSTARMLDIGPAPHRAAYLRFRMGDVDGAVRRVTLHLFKRSTAATAV